MRNEFELLFYFDMKDHWNGAHREKLDELEKWVRSYVIEPFRPFNDWLIYQQIQSISDYHHLNKERKAEFFQLLHADCLYMSERSPLMVAMEYVSANLVKCFDGVSKKLEYPELI